MQLNLADLLTAEHILIGLKATDAPDAINQLSDALMATGYVVEGFADDVVKREKDFPTGLPTEPFAIAIPHADPDHIERSAIAVGILEDPVQFNQMGMQEAILEVHIIFLLAIKEREKQVDMLAQLMGLIQTPGLLVQLSNALNAQQVLEKLQTALM